MSEDDPYSDFRAPQSNLDTILIQLADEYVEAEKEVEEAEVFLETKKTYLRDIVEKKIPEAVEGMNGDLKLSDGRTLSLKEEIRSSIAGEKRIPAIKWLNDNDYGHIVKREVIIEFGKDSEDLVEDFLEYLSNFGKPLVIKQNDSVHHMTLNSWVKEQLREGVNLPKDTFGIFRQRTAKVKE